MFNSNFLGKVNAGPLTTVATSAHIIITKLKEPNKVFVKLQVEFRFDSSSEDHPCYPEFLIQFKSNHDHSKCCFCRVCREGIILCTVYSFVVLTSIKSLSSKRAWADQICLELSFSSPWAWQIECSLCWFFFHQRERPMPKKRSRNCSWTHPVGKQTKFKQLQRFLFDNCLIWYHLKNLFLGESNSCWSYLRLESVLKDSKKCYLSSLYATPQLNHVCLGTE